MFSCEFCEISKNTFLQRTPLVAASIKNATFPQITVLSEANVSKNRMGENKIGEITENGVVPVIALFFWNLFRIPKCSYTFEGDFPLWVFLVVPTSLLEVGSLQAVNILAKTAAKVFCYTSRHRRCSVRKSVLKNFAKFTEKHLCQSLFFNEVAGLQLY